MTAKEILTKKIIRDNRYIVPFFFVMEDLFDLYIIDIENILSMNGI